MLSLLRTGYLSVSMACSRSSLYDGATPIPVPEDEVDSDWVLSGLNKLSGLGSSFYCGTPTAETISEEDPMDKALELRQQHQQQEGLQEPQQQHGFRLKDLNELSTGDDTSPAVIKAKKAFSTGLLGGRTPLKNA